MTEERRLVTENYLVDDQSSIRYLSTMERCGVDLAYQ
jgi:hypothetical protein